MHPNLKTWLARIDQLYIFTPSKWPHRELISRATALTIIAIFLTLRFYRFDRFPGTLSDAHAFYGAIQSTSGLPLYSTLQIIGLWGIKLAVWFVETLIYFGYIASYTSRVKAVEIANGFMETAFPILVAGTPILISFMPYTLPQWMPYSSREHMLFYTAIMATIVFGGLLNLIGLLILRRAFTIMTEARTLVTRGIFRYIRHPLYAGSFFVFLGSLLLRLSLTSGILYSLFLAGQITRAKIEERKMIRAFPQYADYRKQTGMFFPKIFTKRR